MKKLDKKGQSLNAATPIVVGLIVIGLVMSIGGLVTTELESQNCQFTFNTTTYRCQDTRNATGYTHGDDYAFNISQSATDGLQRFGDLTGTLAIVAIAAVIMAVVTFYFGRNLVFR